MNYFTISNDERTKAIEYNYTKTRLDMDSVCFYWTEISNMYINNTAVIPVVQNNNPSISTIGKSLTKSSSCASIASSASAASRNSCSTGRSTPLSFTSVSPFVSPSKIKPCDIGKVNYYEPSLIRENTSRIIEKLYTMHAVPVKPPTVSAPNIYNNLNSRPRAYNRGAAIGGNTSVKPPTVSAPNIYNNLNSRPRAYCGGVVIPVKLPVTTHHTEISVCRVQKIEKSTYFISCKNAVQNKEINKTHTVNNKRGNIIPASKIIPNESTCITSFAVSSETSKASSETSKASSGTSKASSETSKASSGTSKASSETSKASSGTSKASSGTSKASSGTSKASSGTSKASSGTSKASSGTSSVSSKSASTCSKTASSSRSSNKK